MRQAGTLDSQQDAQRFASYLLTLGISAKVEPSGGQWALWIRDENEIDRSKQELAEFRTDPQASRYLAAERAALQTQREEIAKRRRAQKNYVDMRDVWNNPVRRRPVTIALIAGSIIATTSLFGVPRESLEFSLPEILQGEIWRLITPIFMHASLQRSPLHLIFNMWWLYDLGTLIELRLGSWRFATLVLIIGVLSNAGQYIASGPAFGGMSGVVFGLFGYAWVRGRLDPTCGLYLQPGIAFWMMAWLVLCMAGAVENVANTAHLVGLATGAACGYASYAWRLLGR